MSPSTTISQHRALIEDNTHQLTPVCLPLSECFGLVLAQDVTARIPTPPFTNSAMDGFALRFTDIDGANESRPADLPVIGDIPAGDTRRLDLPAGTAMRIMTGAPMPSGADTVVKVEWTDHRPGVATAPDRVKIMRAPAPGSNIRHRGEATKIGALILRSGKVLDGPSLAAAASAGHENLVVVPRPRVVIVATGAELAPAGAHLSHGQIPDSNSVLLEGLVRDAGGEVICRITCGDTPEELLSALACCPPADLLITAGGISAGAYEVVRLALSSTVHFHHIAQQPGGPQGAGTASVAGAPTPTICLPGNPVSVFVSFHVYVAGVIAVLAGRIAQAPGATAPHTMQARAATSWKSPAGKTQFIPLRFVNTPHQDPQVEPVHALGSLSHLVSSLPLAEALGVIEPAATQVEPGSRVEVIDLRPSRPVVSIGKEPHD